MARTVRRRPGIRRNKTVVWFERAHVGTLTKASDGGISFSYDPAWLAAETAFPVASALPLTQADWKGDPVVAAFDNLLPDAEGELRE
jgi:serine/threonine-protein kinase HipA